jgi:hypothetical protein
MQRMMILRQRFRSALWAGAALLLGAGAALGVAAAALPEPPGGDTLRLRITGEGTMESEVCDADGRCPLNEARQSWAVTVTPAGVVAEGQVERREWGVPDADYWEEACYVAGRHEAQFQLTHLAWWTAAEAFAHGLEAFAPEEWSGPDRVLVVGITPTMPPRRGARADGSCPQVIRNSDGQRPYDEMVEELEEHRFFEVFLPAPGAGAMMSLKAETSVLKPESAIIPQFRLEVLEGDPTKLERYTSLRRFLTPLVRGSGD